LKKSDMSHRADSNNWNEKQARLSTSDFDFSAWTHIGYTRKSNQDRYVIKMLQDASVLFAIADGLGGEGAGDLAAETIRSEIEKIVHIPLGEENQTLVRLAKALDLQIRNTGQCEQDLNGMGSTLIIVLIRHSSAWWVHIGDSRLYLFRNSQLIQITEDQTLARFLMEENALTPEQAPSHYSQHVMDQYVGCGYCEPESGTFDTVSGDLIVLASDGIHRHISEEALSDALSYPSDLGEQCHDIVHSVLKSGGKDNLTIMIFHHR